MLPKLVSVCLALAFLSPVCVVGQATPPDIRLRAWEDHLKLEAASPFKDLEWRAVGPMQSGARIDASTFASARADLAPALLGNFNIYPGRRDPAR